MDNYKNKQEVLHQCSGLREERGGCFQPGCAAHSHKVIIESEAALHWEISSNRGWVGVSEGYLQARQISGAISRTLTISNNEQFISDRWSFTMEAYPQRDPVVPRESLGGNGPRSSPTVLARHPAKTNKAAQVGPGTSGTSVWVSALGSGLVRSWDKGSASRHV